MAVILFYIFATVIVASSVMVIASRNPVHSILFLILAFLNAAGVFLLAGAEFLALILAIVYVGAVAVLFLFVVMMLDVDFVQLRKGIARNIPVGGLVALVLLAELALLGSAWQAGEVARPLSQTAQATTNTQALGQVLYTDYILAFLGAGLVLLVAMVAAIVLTLRQREGVLRQDIGKQVNRRISETLAMKNPKPGEGIG